MSIEKITKAPKKPNQVHTCTLYLELKCYEFIQFILYKQYVNVYGIRDLYIHVYIYWAGSLSNICEIQNDMAISAFKLKYNY